jgi:predicted transcriptional regulator
MQLTISISPDTANTLRALAWRECRSPHQQAKWMLTRAIEAAVERDRVPEAETREGATAPAREVSCAAD